MLTVQCSYKLLQLTETLCVEIDYYKREAAQHMLTHLRQFHHTSWQHDFAGKGEYNVLRAVSKSDICCFRGVILSAYNSTVVKLPWKFITLIFAVLLSFLE